MDIAILKNELSTLGHHVQVFDYAKDPDISHADINLFLSNFETRFFPTANLNWLLANPDFCYATTEEIQQLDLVLCKTKECLRIFKPISKDVYYLGFTSLDCLRPDIKKKYITYLHVAGNSPMKGTEEVFYSWLTHPELSQLILINHRSTATIAPKNIKLFNKSISRDSLMSLQNECGIHLCPSKTEGFGHYLMEGMSAEAVVITTDAPPMNEFIKDKRCLVKHKKKTGKQEYATTYSINEKELMKIIKTIQQLSHKELRDIGKTNRNEYLRRKNEFKQNLEKLMQQTAETLKLTLR